MISRLIDSKIDVEKRDKSTISSKLEVKDCRWYKDRKISAYIDGYMYIKRMNKKLVIVKIKYIFR